MSTNYDLITSGALLALSISDLEALSGLCLTVFLLIVTVARYGYKLYIKLRDRKLTKEEREELKQDTAEFIKDTTELVGDIKNNLKEIKTNGRRERPEAQDRPDPEE